MITVNIKGNVGYDFLGHGRFDKELVLIKLKLELQFLFYFVAFLLWQ